MSLSFASHRPNPTIVLGFSVFLTAVANNTFTTSDHRLVLCALNIEAIGYDSLISIRQA